MNDDTTYFCGATAHDTDPELHEGFAQWFVVTRCPHCGWLERGHRCDKVIQAVIRSEKMICVCSEVISFGEIVMVLQRIVGQV